jgi:VWFA-related protein
MARFILGRASSSLPNTVWLTLLAGVILVAHLPSAAAQTPPAASRSSPPSTPQEAPKPDANLPPDELSSRDAPATFKVRVNLVLVRVVVRDASGKVIPNLKKEDFQLEDNRKRQLISTFSVETPASQVSTVKMGTADASPEEPVPVKAPQLPQRFVTLFFDDLHLSMADAMLSKQAATKLLGSMQASDRFAILTTSGQVLEDFNGDQAKLNEAIQRIMPHAQTSAMDCPPMSYYEAYQIMEANDREAYGVAIQDAMYCAKVNAHQAEPLVQSAARRALNLGEFQVRQAFQMLDELIRRMTALPGQRTVVLMSPGFFQAPSVQQQTADSIDRATRSNVVINTIDARGLYVSSMFQADSNVAPSAEKTRLIQTEEFLQNDVLAEIADGTGGIFFHNRNDIDQGLLQAAAEPEVSYVLGFTPDNLKPDGKYHHLKVTLTSKEKCSLQARHGYFAPHGEADPEAAAKDEIRQAVYSQGELHDLPIGCQTQYFNNAAGKHLSVLVHIQTGTLKFRKADDRNTDKLTIATAIFDGNGNLVTGSEKVVEMQLRDSTLGRMNKAGLNVRSRYDLQAGTFLLRIVVRDSEGAQMAALSRGVTIP